MTALRVRRRDKSRMTYVRASLYRFISALFSDPESDQFSTLAQPGNGAVVSAAARVMDGQSKVLADSLLRRAAGERKTIRGEYISLFGHTASKELSLYELEHLQNSDVFYRTQSLADINGFYRAFGLEVNGGERSDHISVELEYLAHLLLLSAEAQERGLSIESEVTAAARTSFWNEHFWGWAPVLLKKLQDSQSRFYRDVSTFAEQFLSFENGRLQNAISDSNPKQDDRSPDSNGRLATGGAN